MTESREVRAGPRVLTRGVGLVLLLDALLYAAFIWRPSFTFRGQRWFTLFDDAMISMTYARNLADGHGLVWNPGGPAVEGYTNPLWTLVLAGLHRLGLSEATIPLAVSVLSAALVLASVVLGACIAARLRPASPRAPLFAAIFVGLYYPLVYWALRGMEVGLVTFLVLAGVLLSLRLRDEARVRDVALLCLAVGAGLLTRDDFLVPAGVLGVWLLVCLRGRDRWVVAGPLALTGVAVLAGQLGFRLWYYGEPLPNTYYLKVAGQPVGARWWRGLLTLVAVVLADALVLVGVVIAGVRSAGERGGGRRAVDASLALVLALVGALAVYSVYVGGDAWEWARLANRYLTPAGVLLLITAAAYLEPLVARVRRLPHAIFAVVAVVASGLLVALVDSFVGVSLHGLIGDYLGVTPTSSDAAVLAVAGLAVVLALAWFAGRTRPLPAALRRGPLLVWVFAVVVLASTTWSAWAGWAGDAGFYVAKNRGATAYGIELGQLTDPGATIAVIWAGAPIYYAHRDGIDLLGKMDPVIAHGPHHEGVPMYPGHDKFDFAYSIGVLRPDVIAQYAWFTRADLDRLVAEGYTPMRFRPGVADDVLALEVPRGLLWVRGDSTKVHRELLEPVPLDEAARVAIEPR